MKTPDLKPCPFCGGKADVFYVDYHRYRAMCRVCGAQTQTFAVKENAIARWNWRVNDENP